ncbi:unnamed protein product [Vitrella brassicaformis CCMP3155]|uniref:Cyclic nucleotide-binding domain-containing protein n=1 Tax=Vitrella brassicaformis (strain CCMP3155) TaxID=1169540 RepID=A0A0G4GFD0_VITBC|nr:unnamed protein product [Vitrella brassicaformis CCMP3155]|eukprot:CEM28247.1 unnamed protein product [Vitrella brassicaformis CCMP3155]
MKRCCRSQTPQRPLRHCWRCSCQGIRRSLLTVTASWIMGLSGERQIVHKYEKHKLARQTAQVGQYKADPLMQLTRLCALPRKNRRQRHGIGVINMVSERDDDTEKSNLAVQEVPAAGIAESTCAPEVIGLTQSNLAASVPPLLYRKFHLQYHRRFFDQVPMFRDQPDHFPSLVVSHLVCRVYMPADYICVKGDYGDEMYFIEEGKVLIYSADESSILHSLGPGDFLGELSLMRGQMRSCSVQADSFCLVLGLKKQHLDRILQAFRNLHQSYTVLLTHVKSS